MDRDRLAGSGADRDAPPRADDSAAPQADDNTADENTGPPVDITVARQARIYDFLLGGKDNFAADREAAAQAIEAFPGLVAWARHNRAFLARAVRYLVTEAGVRQFLDVGTGLPTADNTHEVAQRIAPDSRVVYVDNDPVVLVHAQALLHSTPEGPPRTSAPTCATRRPSWSRPPRPWTSAGRSR